MNEKQIAKAVAEAFGNIQSKKILITAEAIMAYLSRVDGSPVSRPTFLKFVKMGMPVIVIDRVYYAHADNIERFFQQITLARMKQPVEDAE